MAKAPAAAAASNIADQSTFLARDPEEVTALCEALTEDERARADDLEAALKRAPETIDDDGVADKYADFGKQIQALIKALNSKREDTKRPYMTGGSCVDNAFKKILGPLQDNKATVTARLTNFQRAKEARLRQERQEEADRLAAEARAKEAEALDAAEIAEADVTQQQAHDAQAKVPEARKEVVARGDLGSSASLRKTWVHSIEDFEAIDLEALRPFFQALEIDKAIRGFVRNGGRELSGVKIFQRASSVVR